MASAIVVAAGIGIRMRASRPKQYLLLAGRPVLAWTLLPFEACPLVGAIYLVVPGEDIDYCRKEILAPLGLRTPVEVVTGGPMRQDSVYNGLLASEGTHALVAIHDGVRPLVTAGEIGACILEAAGSGACILGLPAVDTVKSVGPTGFIERTLDRTGIWTAQTPQVFRYSLIRQAHERARKEGITGTDDAFLAEMDGFPVRMIPGSRRNLKITSPEDLALAEALLKDFRAS
jgi:2-C-methyl-D-erythritol 4-phosphate cytidylyltransferase